jgi:hypothetical protein
LRWYEFTAFSPSLAVALDFFLQKHHSKVDCNKKEIIFAAAFIYLNGAVAQLVRAQDS